MVGVAIGFSRPCKYHSSSKRLWTQGTISRLRGCHPTRIDGAAGVLVSSRRWHAPAAAGAQPSPRRKHEDEVQA